MTKTLHRLIRILTGITLLIPVFVFAQSIDDTLKEAEAIKSRDPAGLVRLLDSLAEQADTFSPQQTYLYTYLSGYKLGFSGDTEGAAEKYRHVIEGTADTSLKLKSSTALLNIYAITRNYTEGYALVNQLNTLVGDASDTMYVHVLIGKAIFFNQAADYDTALVAARQALEKATSQRLICFANNLIVEARYHLNTIHQLSDFDNAISVCETAKEPVAIGLTRVFEARYLLNSGQSAQALALLTRHAALFNEINYPRAQTDYYAALATLHYEKKHSGQAEEAANRALALSEQMGATQPRVEALGVLYKLYEEQGQIDKAFTTYKQFAEMEKAYLDSSLLNRLAALQAKSNMQAKESQIQILDKQNSLLLTAAQLKNEELENSRLLIAVLLLLGGMVLVWTLINNKMHRELRIQAQTDNLTGIANRHYLTALAGSNLRYHQRTGQPLGFVIFDLDLFKNINDSYGHQIGDWALQAVVKAIQSVCRQQDIIGRMGGEEFALLLPACPVEKARLLAEDCRSAIAAIDTSESGQSFSLTASFGVTDTENCGYSFDALYATADAALYRSKHEGRNRVFCHTSIPPSSTKMTEQPV